MPRIIPRIAVVWLAALPFMSTNTAAATSPGLALFQDQAAETLEAKRIPGAGIALISEGEVLWAGGIGRADLAAGRPVLRTTRFRVGSITKMFTAIAVLQLVDEGRLSLNDRVIDLAPEVPIENPWRNTDPVRVAHLLEHTAGFDDMHFRNMNTVKPLPDTLQNIVIGLEHELRVRWRPGVKHSYANPGYAVAAYLVEKISGKPFHEYLRDNVTAALSLQHVAWGVPEDDDFATGYGALLRPIPPRPIRLYPAGEMSASSADLAKLVQFFLQRGALNEGRLLPESLIERMETPQTTRAARQGLETGYGLGNYTVIRQRFRLHGHNGGLDGFISELAYSPEHNFGYVILLNRVDPEALRAIAERAVDVLAGIANASAPQPGELDAVSATLPAEIDGCYRMRNPRNQLLYGVEWLVQVMCLTVEDGRALARHPVMPQLTAFVPVRNAVLREQGGAWPVAAFMNDGALTDAFEWSGIYFERSSRFWITAPLVLVIAALLLMLSAFVFFPVWLIRAVHARSRNISALAMRIWPLIASALFAGTLVWSTRLELSLLDSVNPVSLGILVGGVAFAFASFIALYYTLRGWRASGSPFVRWHSLLVALACTGVTLYLVYWQLIPLRLWAW